MNFSQTECELASGFRMPMFGLGTFLLTDEKVLMKVIDEALGFGYRLIDTAASYGNEEKIGKVLKKLLPKHSLKREDVFITSKLSPTNHGDDALKGLERSLKNLQCDYIDLYLIHWPGSSDYDPRDRENRFIRNKSWSYLVEGKQKGLARSLGVSNYTINHLSQLLGECGNELPAVNQIEYHPQWHEDDLLNFCRSKNIVVQAFSSFGGSEGPSLLIDPAVLKIAHKLEKSPAQVLLIWALQQNIAVIPRSSMREHLEINSELDFRIPDRFMKFLSTLPQKRYGSDPTVVN